MDTYSGYVLWYDNKKGFGVIKPTQVENSPEEVFLHYSNVINKERRKIFIKENDKVEFKLKLNSDKNKYESTNVKIIDGKKINKIRVKNTETFEPNHSFATMRVLIGDPLKKKYQEVIYSRDVIIIPNFTGIDNIYNKLLEEIKNSKVNEDNLWKLWHGDTHLIADDHLKWKSECPTFNQVLDKIKNYFTMDIKASRFNLYRDSNDWKPFHHDAAAVKENKAKTQNFTVGISFGLKRDVCFENAKTKETTSFPLDNDTLYAFSKDINIDYKHGIPQIPQSDFVNKGRISIIAWGKTEMKDV